MSAAVISAAMAPDAIPHHDGVTHLMFAPHAEIEPAIAARWHGLRAAIHMAGGHTQAIDGPFDYDYARDLCVLVGDTAFHPSVPFDGVEGHVDHRRRAFLPFVAHYGYSLQPLDTLPDYGIDGGNFVPLEKHGVLLSGTFTVSGEPMDIDIAQSRAKIQIGAQSDLLPISVQASTWHIDSVAGLLPDGRLLMKLDESEYRFEAKEAGLTDEFLSTAGVEPRHMHRLARVIGRHNILTFSAFEHPDADVVCDPAKIAGSSVASRAFGLAANAVVVNDALVGETMHPALADRLRGDGIKLIGPRDVGLETFVYGDEGFTGAARCMTLPVRHQPRARAFYF